MPSSRPSLGESDARKRLIELIVTDSARATVEKTGTSELMGGPVARQRRAGRGGGRKRAGAGGVAIGGQGRLSPRRHFASIESRLYKVLTGPQGCGRVRQPARRFF